VHAVRKDIADISLASRIFAPHYAQPEHAACILPSEPIRSEPSHDGRAVSQLLHGEGFAVVDVAGEWAWGYSLHDCYVGYILQAALGPVTAVTHVVHTPAALLFAEADIKSAVRAALPFGAALTGVADDRFLATAHGHVHLRHVRAIAAHEADPVAVAERMLGLPYRWGGRGGDGFDCSGLVQAALAACGIVAPRDSDQQMAELGAEIAADVPLMRGDLIFFPGHVGFMVDGDRLIHANAHWMAVTVEPLAEVIARIDADTPVLARKRLKRA
jgi:cell wall-associated NlpC family hydrolase